MNFINWVSTSSKNIVNNLLSISKQSACQIKEFNLQAKEVIIYCYGIRIITIRSSIREIIGDPNIIINLPADQACWLGYYYGKLYIKAANEKYLHTKSNSFLLRFTKGKFKIFSFDRENILTYIDIKTNQSYKGSPVDIARNKSVIYQFDSSQACYIGILAGLMIAREEKHTIEVRKKPILTLIK